LIVYRLSSVHKNHRKNHRKNIEKFQKAGVKEVRLSMVQTGECRMVLVCLEKQVTLDTSGHLHGKVLFLPESHLCLATVIN
jgi:hypothetical protein